MASSSDTTLVDINLMLWNLHSSDPQSKKKARPNSRQPLISDCFKSTKKATTQTTEKDSTLHSNDPEDDKRSLASDRPRAMQHVLQAAKRAMRIPLFLFCQERITDKKHKLICKEFDSTTITNDGKQVNIYYWKVSSWRVEYIITNGDGEKELWRQADELNKQTGLHKYFDSGKKRSDQADSGEASTRAEATSSTSERDRVSGMTDDTVLARLRACVYTPPSPLKLLLLSWHGPRLREKKNKVSKEAKDKPTEETRKKRDKNQGNMTLDERTRIFRTLLLFVEKLRDKHGCDLAVIGGDFNISAKDAKVHAWKDAKVYSDYQQPQDRAKAEIRDFMVVLSKRDLAIEIAETSVLHQYYRRERPRMFEHPLVRFRLIISQNMPLKKEPGGAQQEGYRHGEEGEGEERERDENTAAATVVPTPSTSAATTAATIKGDGGDDGDDDNEKKKNMQEERRKRGAGEREGEQNEDQPKKLKR